jgi:small nuclear ribonucleoprotein (snRNP)-like protein
MSGRRTRFDPFALRDVHSPDAASPISYARRFLGRRLRVLLADGGRQLVGTFAALDGTGALTLRECLEFVGDHERSLGTVIAPLALIQSIETVPDGAAGDSGGRGSGR